MSVAALSYAHDDARDGAHDGAHDDARDGAPVHSTRDDDVRVTYLCYLFVF